MMIPDHIQQMHDYYMDGYSIQETADHFYYHWRTVYRYFKRHGLYIRSHSEAAQVKWHKRKRRQVYIVYNTLSKGNE